MRHTRLDHRFVEYVPEILEPGMLYISTTYATAVHKCCCGCGLDVVTPLTPTDWRLTFDGETVSLNPSIGNWEFPCRSHYIIDRGRVVMARPWSDRQVAAERQRDRRAKTEFYGVRRAEPAPPEPRDVQPSGTPIATGLWPTIKRLWRNP
jgi:hypothetical protein